MDKFWKSNAAFLITHIIMSMVTVLIMTFCDYLMEIFGRFVFSTLTSLLYLSVMYPQSWRLGARDSRPNNENMPNPFLAARACVLTVAIALILASLMYVQSISAYIGALLGIWFSMFTGFFPIISTGDNMIFIPWYATLLCALVYPTISFIGYRVGMTRFSVSDKISQKFGVKLKGDRERRVYK